MESWDSDCPNCDPSGSIAGLIGAQFCAAESRPAPSSLNPGAPEFQLPASSTRIVSLPRSSEGGPSSLSNTQPPEERHASEQMQSLEERQASEGIQPPEEKYASEEIQSPGERHASEDIGSPGEGHVSEERYASQEIQSPRKRHVSEDIGSPKKRQSLSPSFYKISSRESSKSPEPTHPARGIKSPGNISSPVTAPTPDVVAPPPVEEETHEADLDQNPPVSHQIQSHVLFPPLVPDQEKKPEEKPEEKPGPTWAKIARVTTKKTNQSSAKLDWPSTRPNQSSENLGWEVS
ncbi:hypothetical protein FOXG_18758 [Fusarium oxysporum f. sp. lycopersici 4287]|uniref:Uncharacterized protein n=2 Tax=Fusarium oxysporum TaxID=5507 RepID=A0A0J9UNZ0_FUSO4|nr:hypothetical protein FOXG_18758 [Fusarium oxysporum f. sp. lycopersici 4287]EXK44285.1 hypothetical protein FOMG_03035 [Fusarium oxysporum f. sp. melonis 26406]KNB00648.1 hypothetical protein FOXG_18758 [Fusarium oxysporum f. sp. lycopersici 4287]